MWCKQCKRDRAPSHFLKVKRPWRVELCNDCASENVRRWSRKVEMDPDKVRRAGKDE